MSFNQKSNNSIGIDTNDGIAKTISQSYSARKEYMTEYLKQLGNMAENKPGASEAMPPPPSGQEKPNPINICNVDASRKARH